jgi:hypothetical protein
MVNYEIEDIHSGKELIKLEYRRKSAEKILETIREQEALKGHKKRTKRTKEEFVTRYLRQHRKYLITEKEVIIFDQYPLRKRPVHPKRVDIIYIYRRENTWSLGIVEAKVEGGEGLTEAVNQLQEYKRLFKKHFSDRRKSFRTVVDNLKPIVTLPSDCQITQLDILAPSVWWNEQKEKEHDAILEMRKHKIRPLCIPDDYLPEQWPPKDIPVNILQAIS